MNPTQHNTIRFSTLLLPLVFYFLCLQYLLPVHNVFAETFFLSPEEYEWLQEHKDKLRIAPDPHYPPIEYYDEHGVHVGIAADYIDLIQQKLQVEFKFVRLKNFQEILEKARTHDIDIIASAIKTESREKFLDFTSPYIKIPNVIIVRKEDPRLLSLTDLKGMTGIVYQAGYTIGDVLMEKQGITHARPITDPAEALRDLSMGRINVIVGNIGVLSHYASREGIPNLRVAGDCDFDDVISFASRNDLSMINVILEKTLGQITAQEREEIKNRWIKMEAPGYFPHKRFWTGIFGIAGLSFAVLVLFYAWNRTLHRQVGEKTQELKKSEEKYRLIADNMADVIAIIDLDLKLVYVSPSIMNVNGYRVEEAVGKSIKSILTPESVNIALEYFEEEKILERDNNADPARTRVIELEQYKKSGETIWTQIAFSFLRDEDGRPTGILTITRDITIHKEAEKQRKQLEIQLRHAQKMEAVGKLAGGVAHDFNNMLSIINGYAEMSLETLDPQDLSYRNFQEIRKAGLRSADLVRQLLAFARKQPIAPVLLDLNETVSNMLSMLQRLIGEDIALLWKPGKGIWQVKIDPSQVDQLLANLTVNSRDAITDVGKITIETANKTFDHQYCRMHTDFVEGQFVMLAVSDDGCGMDQTTIDRLFEPFFTTKPQGKGTGLGLPMVYGIVKQNNGFINCYSEPGKGTTLKIYLPRHENTHVSHMLPSTLPASIRQITAKTILLVEDNQQLLALANTMLETLGHTVLPASSPTEAIQLATAYPGEIELLLTDVIMPEMNGRALKQQVRMLRPDIKCLFISGYTANVIEHHGVLNGEVCFLQKPFSITELNVKLQEIFTDEEQISQLP